MFTCPTLSLDLGRFPLKPKMQYSDAALDEDLTRLTGAWAEL